MNHPCFSMQHLIFSYKLPQATSQYSFFSCYWHYTSLPLLHHHTLQEVFQTQWSLIIFLDVVLHQPCISLIRKPWSYSVQSDVNMKYRSLYCTEKRSWETAKNSTLRLGGTATHIWGFLGRYFNLFSSNYSDQFGFGALNRTKRNGKILVKGWQGQVHRLP